MKNEMQKYNAFSAQKVYETLAEGLDGLSVEEQVLAISYGIPQMKQRLDEIVEKFQTKAVSNQESIVQKKDEEVNKKYTELDNVRKTQDLDQYDVISSELIDKLTNAKYSVEGLRLLRSGKFEVYVNRQKLLGDGE